MGSSSLSKRVSALVAPIVGAAVVSLSVFACSSEEAGIPFHGEAPALPGFSYDTGMLPGSGPAQVSLKLSAGGPVVVDAEGVADGGKLTGKPGTGRVKLDVHVKLEGKLKVDTSFKKYDGELPGLSNIDVPIVAEAPFDPFLLDGGSALVSADVPETNLPDIPLGSVPGNLRLTIVAGSKLTAKYTGACMAVSGGQATHTGSAVVGGTLQMKGAIVLDLPAPFDKTVDLAQFSVPIPETTRAIPFGAVAVSSVDDGNQGSGCSGAVGTPDGGVIGEDGAVVTPDGAACDASNCTGCCRDGVCLGGTSALACGKPGAACETCPSGAECSDRACVRVGCDSSNCAGCCQAGQCVTGTSVSQCGAGGGACQNCGTGNICSGGTCIATSCQSSCTTGCCSGNTCNTGTSNTACGKAGGACVSCGANRTCNAGACVVDPLKTYDLVLVAASVPTTNASGNAWDAFSGLPDPYAKVVSTQGASKHEGQTPFLSDTPNPIWNATVLTGVTAGELKSSVRIDLFDDDVAVDDTIGGCALVLTDAVFDGTLRNGSCPASAGGVAFTFSYKLIAK